MIKKCTYTQEAFKQEVSLQTLSIFNNDTLSDVETRNELFKAFASISEQMGLTGPSKIEEALNIIKDTAMFFFDKERWLDDNDIRTALSAWKHNSNPETEDTTADHLVKDNEKLERINEDPFETYYQFATNAKIRAKQQANKIGVRSILYNESGIINSITELNESIRDRQEELLKTVIDYLKTRISQENQLKHPEIFSNGRMYNGEKYTGIVEQIQELYGSILNKENFDPRILNKYYNDGNYDILDSYSSWIILNNFDNIIQNVFGKAISINPDMAKFTRRNKYRVTGGSNVYNTWRTSEDIDMTKEVNNITQAIITSLPFIPKGSTTPSQSNIKFNEFLYIISKIKGLIQSADKDWTIKINGFDEAFRDKYNGKSFLQLINSIRTNPQEVLPDIFKLLNNDNVINSLIGAGVIESNTFLNVDLNLINSLYEGLFNSENPNSLFSIQDRTGFNKINYFAFIGQTIDSAFKSTYLQYFRNPQGEIFIRNMYDQSISNIEYTIRDTINSINSKIMQQEQNLNKYDFKTENRKFVEGQSYNVYYGRNNYTLTVNNGQIYGYYDNNNPITSQELLDKLIKTFNETPDNVQFTIKDYRKGPLKVTVSLNKNTITYEVDGKRFDSFNSNADYDSLSDIIQEVLRQNLNIDNAYFDAYKNKFKFFEKAEMATNLMSVVSRVLANKYLSNTLLNGLTPTQISQKLNQIFGKGKSDIKPVINKQLGEINLLTDSNTRVLLDLAEAKAQSTGRLTSSQVIDSNGNAVASSCLSRLLSAYGYQITEQVQKEGSAAQGFSFWNTGVFKGISQMKEIQDNSEDSSKSSTEFSNAEMEYATVFIDFIQSLLTDPINGKSTLQKGLAAFIPSENSDKTYIGRMLIDLAKLQVNGESIYDILRKDPRRIDEIIPVFAKELDEFYNKALTNINSTWARVGLVLGTNVSYGNWGAVALQALKEGKSTLQYINDKVTQYNNQNPTNPIVLIDQVHYVANKNGELMINESFLENTKRFKDPVNLQKFLIEQNIETVKQLLKDRLRVPITPEIQSKIAEWRITDWKEASKWIDERTGEMIFAKVHEYELATGETSITNIRRHNDLSLLEELDPNIQAVEINPILESYNILNYFLTQEFMGSTVGMFYAHPNKKVQNIQQLLKEGKINIEQAHQIILKDEKARKLAQDKRNVSFTASMHSFLKGLIQGIPDEINIAIMDDPHDAFSTVSGDTFDIKPFDGCTFENPWFGEMENASLGGAKVGVNKKTFTHYYDARTGTGGIIKTANFPLTNDRIRGSKFYQRMIRNMTDRTWKNQNGTDFIIPQDGYEDFDETRTKGVFYVNSNNLVDYNGNPIEFTNPNDINGSLYFKQNGKYYNIVSVEYLGNNQFRRYLQEVDIQGRAQDKNGNPTEMFAEDIQTINSNYKLWNLFGGAYAMEIAEGTNSLQYTENSIKIVANIINSIGTDPNDKTGQTLPSGVVRTQADVYQPLKHSDIHLMPTVGAVKQGAGNINGKEKYNISDPSQINFMKIKMNQAGIQLDKEHHADDEDLSIMTQVISACAARGYTQEQQQQMLNALASLARAGINEYLDAFNEFFEAPEGYVPDRNPDGSIKTDDQGNPQLKLDENGNYILRKDRYQQVILDTLVDALIHSTNSAATLQMVTQELINKAKEGKDIAFKDTNIPYSDPAVFRKLHSTIAVALTRGAIKIKVQGILSVLCPSFNIVKLYNGKTLSSFDSDEQIQSEQETFDALEYNNLVNDIGRLKLGRTYKLLKNDGSLELRNVITQGDYYTLKQQIANGEYYSVKEQFAPVKDIQDNLNPTNVSEKKRVERYNEVIQKFGKPIKYDKVISDISDSNTYLITFENGTIQVTPKAGAIIVNNGEFVGNKDINYFIGACKVLENLNKTVFEGGRELASYNATFQALKGTATYNINDLASVNRLWQLKEAKASNEEIDQALQEVQSDLMKLHNKKGSIVLMNGTEIQIDPKSINIEPYEIVMPKIFASTFGLEIRDDLNAIKQDREFFVKRLIQSIKPKVSNQFYSIGLMNIGSHSSMYILDRNQRIPNDTDNFVQKDISQISEKGKLWRVNKKGEKMYQMQKGDTVYEYRHPNGISYEVIVSDKPEFYVKNGSYITLNCSSSYNTDTFYNILTRNTKQRAVRDFKDTINSLMESYGDSLEDAIENVQNVGINDIDESPIGQYFLDRGHEIHTSFLQSLKVVAARVPAQSMQSFMPMRVVAFEAPDINTAYVNTAQFLFQGSDLDIDAVSLASFTFDKSGRYVMHSPYANIDTIENLEASEEIPFPIGKRLTFGEGYNFDYGQMMPYDDSSNPNLPFDRRNGKLTLKTPQAIRRFAKFIDMCNKLGYVPKANHPIYEDVAKNLLDIVNKHNNYIHSDEAEDFSKNYVVSSMYKIGLSPANMIESQQAMDSITDPLKKVANNTIKAQEQSLENPANFTTNIHGIAQNMAGKKGVGICAVGLKSFFALTARYNEVLRSGTPEEQERLKSDVIIAGKRYQMLANAYGTNISNQAIAQVVSELSNQDQALILSALLSLATDNAKELALDKLNASNMLGMYIYGITIGVDFKTLADIICSNTGLVINEMMKGNSFLKQRGMNIQNIFDYLELAPNLTPAIKLSRSANEIFFKLNQQELFNLTHSGLPVEQQFATLDEIKKEIDKNILHSTESEKQEYYELHRLVEQAEDYVERFNSIEWNIYKDFKKLNEGADELRRLGQLLHINKGLENSYSKSINYLETVTSVIADRQYSIERENRRYRDQQSLTKGEKLKYVQIDVKKWKFDFHQFVTDENYREAWIDIYEGKCNQKRFTESKIYRNQFIQIFPQVRNASVLDNQYKSVLANLKPSKVFFNILDVLQVPHFAAYLQSADMLHQAMMKTSVKYRSVYNLGKRAINLLGAYSTDDKEAIYRRTEQMVDRIMRDRYYLSKGISFKLPARVGYFVKENEQLKRKTTSSSTTPIELGTDEGNASFKLFMETVIIPNLIKGKYGDGNNINPALSKNEFIKSLAPTLYKHNARYNVTINYAPGINMSPRSDAEKALFEKIKYDFNAFRSGSLSKVKYKIGDKYYDIPELFYYYNQIAFGGRPGENTLTSIFQDILDYKPIKEYRDYESKLDMDGVIEVDDNLLERETALRRNPQQSNMSYIYYEDSDTGLLSFWSRLTGKVPEEVRLVNKYNPQSLNLSEESKNFYNPGADKVTKSLILSNNEKINIEITKGKITKITRGDKSELQIPKEAKPYFDNPPISVLIQPDGSKQLVYDTNRIRQYVERLINKCS